jgi:dihydroorotate dehydrogenase
MTFVAKTTTLSFREGNMPLEDDHTPEELFPKCIVVKPFKGVVLNAVGLSGPGARVLLADGRWQKRTKPFFISFMPVEKDPESRIREFRDFVEILGTNLSNFPTFRKNVGLQINESCPNVGLHHDGAELTGEVCKALDIAARLEIPLVPKLNVLAPIKSAVEISRYPSCDAICVSNTVPWGKLPELIDWEGIFGSKESPLKRLGGGGLSGKPLLPIVIDWLKRARRAGLEKPINGGGGILSRIDAAEVLAAGADSISLGSVAILRQWRVQGIIRSFQTR